MTSISHFYSLGYHVVKKMPDGSWIGVMPMLFTTGLFVGLDEKGYDRRYCYANSMDAMEALLRWDGVDDPPGPWIKEKPSNRLGPGAVKED
jgi:hypothetical protein